MIRYFLKAGFRNTLRHGKYSLIGILSLSTGITILILTGLFAGNEFSVDRFHRNASRIYKLSYGNSSFTPGPLSTTLRDNFPEINTATHVETHQLFAFSPVLNCNGQSFEIEGYYSADSSFLNVFDFEVLRGDVNTALSMPFSIVLTQSEARRIFNSRDPVGQTITWRIYRDFSFTVTAIVRDPPRNSSLRFNGLISESSLGKMGRHYHDDWGYTSYETYLLIDPAADPMQLERKLRGFLIDYYATNLSTRPCYADASTHPLALHALRDVYFDADLTNDTTNGGNRLQLDILIAVSLIILLLCMINYINLSVAAATTRAREIGIQKACGSGRGLLTARYLTEAVLISIIAALLGLIASLAILPGFSRFMNIDPSLKISPPLLLIMLPGAILLGVLAGIYPALVMSSRNIIASLKNQSSPRHRGLSLRWVLIIFQFSVSMVMIAGTLTINKQLVFIRNKDLGITSENVIYLKLPFQIMRANPEVFRDRIMELSDVKKVGFSSTVFGEIENLNSQEVEGRTVNFATIWTDPEFVDLYGIKLVKGRLFSRDLPSDRNTTALLNESAVREFNVEDPFRISLRVPGGEARVVGIVRDFHFRSLHSSIGPMAIIYLPSQAGYVNIRMSGSDLRNALEKIEEIWTDLAPGFPFNYKFLETGLESRYRNDERMGQAILYFSVVAMIIAVLGILGISAFSLEKRIKEAGIHKVFGAKSRDLQVLFNRNFLPALGASFAIACPVTWYFMHKWLEGFAYRTGIGIWIYLLSGFIAALITLSAAAWQSRNYARRNPVDALRYE